MPASTLRRSVLGALPLLWSLPLANAQAPSTPPSPAAYEAELISLIRANSHELSLAAGKLQGPGADRLRQAAREAQFLVLAEEHYVKEIPPLVTALLSELRPLGFDYLAVESGTVHARQASLPPQKGDREQVFAYVRRYPYALTFFSDQEAEMLADAGRTSRGRGHAVWGLDQEFGALHVLDELLPLAPSEAARAGVRALRAAAEAHERVRDDQRQYIAEIAARDAFDTLPALFDARGNARARWLIDALRSSKRIYQHYRDATQGLPTAYLNGLEREEYMKRVFLEEYRSAERLDGRAPRVIVKAGHWHALKGMNPGFVFTLGDFLQHFAFARGFDSYHLSLHVHGHEGHWREVRKSPSHRVFAEACPPDRWTLVDLRPMRPHVRTRRYRELPDETRRVFFTADALLVMGGAQPATKDRLR